MQDKSNPKPAYPTCPHEIDGEIELSCAPCAVEAERKRVFEHTTKILEGWYRDTKQGQTEAMAVAIFIDLLSRSLSEEISDAR